MQFIRCLKAMNKHLYVCMIMLFFTLSIVGCKTTVSGPKLCSESETINLAKENEYLTSITKVEMATAGPIYRVVFGEDASEQQKAVWVDDKVVFRVRLDQGISRTEAIKLAKQKNFGDNFEIQFIYISETDKENIHRQLRVSPSNVFWWIRSPEAEAKHQMFLNFYDGSIVYEINL